MIIIKNGTIVQDTVFNGDIAIDEDKGVIKKIAPIIEATKNDIIVDADGCYVFPGFIDAHTHFQMTNAITTTADSYYTGTKAAILGGTTTIINFTTGYIGKSLKHSFDQEMVKANGNCSCNYKFHVELVDINDDTLSEMPYLKELGVTSYKLYMAYAFRVDDTQIYNALKRIKEVGGLLEAHCENGAMLDCITKELIDEGETEPKNHPLAHPVEAEAEAISRLSYFSKLLNYPVLVVHLSSKTGMDEVRKARANGADIKVETCPQYLVLDDSVYNLENFEAAKYVFSPPARSLDDQNALIEAIANGEIQTIATDHCSYSYENQKKLGLDLFTHIPGGIPGVEDRVKICYTKLLHRGIIDEISFVKLLSENPARLYGMYPKKGVLKEGSDADIVIYEKDGLSTISAKTHHQNVDYNPYEGFEVHGRVRDVFIGGKHAVQDGVLIKPNLGKYVHQC